MKILMVFGTRPEAIKLAPIVLALSIIKNVEPIICVTGQHRSMLDQVLDCFGIQPDYDLNIMRPGQNLEYITSEVLNGVGSILKERKPEWVVVQGDTTSAFAAALAGFYEKVPVCHVEAGLRTYNPLSPWPEEMNRRLIAPIAQLHCSPTEQSKKNLIQESIPSSRIVVTGNTVIDALKLTAKNPEGDRQLEELLSRNAPGLSFADSKRILLVTLHRRENLGYKIRSICEGLLAVAARGDVNIAFPVHLNPLVQSTVNTILGKIPNVHLLPPLDYLPFVALMRRSYLVITDSGGIQEEAPGLGIPVIVARDTTERPEAIAAGTALLAGTDGEQIASFCSLLLDNHNIYAKMSNAVNPFGDGKAANKIVDAMMQSREAKE